jgi:hypothetical protein
MPRAALIYGLLGLIPFLAPPMVAIAHPGLGGVCGVILMLYGALILSFLGGARWGFAWASPTPGVGIISLSMLPTLTALAILVLPPSARAWRLLGLAAALVAQGLWDIRDRGLPGWYPRLRTILTLGAVAGLGAGAAVCHG